ncbi:jg22097 [Pararge aegeria aegeria]|uniref:Jg22097 protein n=1 Tax=Pararge aegeria aegeria TaxID=348720 RepID=A0A8S4RN21_9NEOP|nr:jg22097 [Pararge aegeria aegeria]
MVSIKAPKNRSVTRACWRASEWGSARKSLNTRLEEAWCEHTSGCRQKSGTGVCVGKRVAGGAMDFAIQDVVVAPGELDT